MSIENPARYHAIAVIDPATPQIQGQGFSAISVPSAGVIALTLENPLDPTNRGVLLTAGADQRLIQYIDTDDDTITVTQNDPAGTGQNEAFSIVVLNLFQES